MIPYKKEFVKNAKALCKTAVTPHPSAVGRHLLPLEKAKKSLHCSVGEDCVAECLTSGAADLIDVMVKKLNFCRG